MQLRMGADPGAAAGQLVRVTLKHHRLPADLAQRVGGEQASDRAADDQGALGHAVRRSNSAISSAVSRAAPARTFCSTCSGVVAPAMTLTVTGLDSSQPKASSSVLWPL